MSKYLIKLTPHDKFFFGGENTFGEGNKNYFVKSNYFPQQTSLLGLIRYQLLLQNSDGIFKNNEIIKEKKGDVEDLIGAESFNIEDKDFSFGCIEKISPVFIADTDNIFLFPSNKEYQWVDKEDDNEIKDFVFREFDIINHSSKSSLSVDKDFIPCLKNYKAKDGLPDLLVNKDLSIKKYYDFDPDKERKPENGIFIEQKQVGIRKNYEGKSDKKAFYVQTFYKLGKGYSFAFILELKNRTDFKTNEIVILGGEQSKFKMAVDKDFKENFEDLIPKYEKSDNSDKVVLVSDTYASNEVFKVCDFAITEIIDFRAIKSSVESTKNYAALSKRDLKSLDKTSKYNFFKRGSVFYGDTKNISDKLNNHTLHKIGYNHFKII